VPTHYDRYLAVEQAIYGSPIALIRDLRARDIRRGDGSVGPMTFAEISEIITELAAKHAALHKITPVTISYEAVRRWWRHFNPDEPTRRSTRDGKAGAMTLRELEQADPTTAAEVRKELGL
jgi:hypothetical protein